jgi:HPt (histidine-containing phosphotransfer) domain-containing protein
LKNEEVTATLDLAIDAGELDQVFQLAHGVKGVAANLGATALALTAADLERAARGAAGSDPGSDLLLVRAAFDSFKTCMDSTLVELGAFFDRRLEGNKPTISRPISDPGKARQALGQAADLLDQDLGAAINLLDGIGADLEQSPLSEMYRRLRMEVAEIDTDLARQTIEEILSAIPITTTERYL